MRPCVSLSRARTPRGKPKPMAPHSATLWLESDSDVSSEPSDLPNAELSDVDAVVAKTVFERLFQRLRLLDMLKVDHAEQAAEMSRGVGLEISRVMTKQSDLERKFEDLLIQREALKHVANRAPYLENQQRVSETARELRVATHEIGVNLKESPDVRANVLFAVTARTELMTLLSDTLETLDSENSFPAVVRKRVKERAKDFDKEATKIRENEISGEVQELRGLIANEKEKCDSWATEKSQIIDSLKAALKTKKAVTGSETRFAKKDVVANSECHARQRAQDLAALRRSTEALQNEIKREKQAHREIQTYLEKRDGQLSERVLGIESKHETDKEQRSRMLSETKARLELLQEKVPAVREAYERELGLQKIREEEKRNQLSQAELDAAGGKEVRERAAARMQFLHGKYKQDRDDKIAQKEAAKAEADASKKDKGDKKGKKKK